MRRKPNAPPLPPRRVVSTLVDVRMADRLEAMARSADRSLSGEIRRALAAHVAAHPPRDGEGA